MAWSAPRTWVTGETVTSALMNTHLRDNLLETSAATAQAAGDIVYADAANSMGSRVAIGAAGSRLVSDGSDLLWLSGPQMARGDAQYDPPVGGPPTSGFEDLDHSLWGEGTSVTVTVTTGTSAVVIVGCRDMRHATAGAIMTLSYRVSGATTIAASATYSISHESGNSGDVHGGSFVDVPTLTAGVNTFTLQGMATIAGGDGFLRRPNLVVIP